MNKTSAKLIPIYASAAAVIAAAVRFFQYVSLIDYSTGFYLKGAELAGGIIYMLLGAAAVVFIVLAVMRKKKGDAAFFLSSDSMGERATQPLGIAFLLAAVSCLFELISESSGLVGQLLTVVPAILFAVTGFVLIKNIIPPAYVGIIQMFLAVIWFVKSSLVFTDDLIVINHSDNLLRLLVYIFTSAFFASTARFYARTETRHSRMREINTAGLLFILSASYLLSKSAALLFGGSAVKGMSGIDPNTVTSLALSASFLFVIFLTSGSREIDYYVDRDAKKKEERSGNKSEDNGAADNA